jgi:hypothetical protein
MRLQVSELFDDETVKLINLALGRAQAFASADPILQETHKADTEFELRGAVSMLVKRGERDVVKLANGAIARLREREQIRRSVAALVNARRTKR